MQLSHTVNSMSTVADTVLFSHYPSTMLFHIKCETGLSHVSLSMRGLACGTDNQVSVAVGPWLLVLVNAIAALTHKAFVFHHAAVSAHPLCQPASLSPGIIYPRSTEYMGHSLSLSLLLTRGTTPCLSQSSHPVFWAKWCNVLPQPIGLNVIFNRPAAPGACHLTQRRYRESRCNHGNGFSKTPRASPTYG